MPLCAFCPKRFYSNSFPPQGHAQNGGWNSNCERHHGRSWGLTKIFGFVDQLKSLQLSPRINFTDLSLPVWVNWLITVTMSGTVRITEWIPRPLLSVFTTKDNWRGNLISVFWTEMTSFKKANKLNIMRGLFHNAVRQPVYILSFTSRVFRWHI